jgi:isocitrate dehydrogenase kinase/phosphatase
MTQRLTDSRLANIGAGTIHKAYITYRNQFQAITQRAPDRFARQDWAGMQSDAAERLVLYRQIVNLAEAAIRDLLEDREDDKFIWASMKAVYSGAIAGHDDWELAETFFNSITRRLFSTVGVDPRIEFVDTDFETPPTRTHSAISRTFGRAATTEQLIRTVLEEYAPGRPYRNLAEDAALVAQRVEAQLKTEGAMPVVERLEVIRNVFYRGMGAYLVGRLFSGSHQMPFILALIHARDGVIVDSVLLDENSASILFSFAHSYFHVDLPRPYDVVHFLRSMLPRKRTGELYISLGYNKHGKTELYRDMLDHLDHSDDKFVVASGQRGMVMLVFTMPSYDMVFKLIKDHFNYPKDSTRKEVKAKYDLVYRHDRAGRLVDAQGFEFLEFERRHFSEELLAEFARDATQTVRVEGDTVVIGHAYVERRVIPLDIYVREEGPAAACSAVIDYGQAIKDMALSNIFPGDMLLKNFGVTRHGRVVFYDYDELCLLTDCTFREMPRTDSYEDELSSEPWFHVNDGDIFPQEFVYFLGLAGELREVFDAHHGDLFRPETWQGMQQAIRAGDINHIFPYMPEQRLHTGEIF